MLRDFHEVSRAGGPKGQVTGKANFSPGITSGLSVRLGSNAEVSGLYEG